MSRLKIIEQEPMVITTCGTFPQSQAGEIIRGMNERFEAQKKEEAAKLAKRPALKRCPFSTGVNSLCKGERCALFVDYACALVTGAPVKESRQCPFGNGYQPCTSDCALYVDNRCAMSRKD